ncbi:hypothetical protein FNV43_RR05720 [Rhamnella rubrinervis]|uniref:Uncharacterized protein n=1 Tax=Rhamnella rubrinervis TaxID=2594499 RepID=A0A8K0MQX5_9ROSA|nr:hypothetical protein FNV43_RR05720 [Rhamnella rubrinervis]
MRDTYDNMVMDKEGELCDRQMTVIEDDSEVQYITPSKVAPRKPGIKKHVERIKLSFIVTIETCKSLKSTFPHPIDFNPKRAPLDVVSMRFFEYMTSDVDKAIDYDIYEVNKEFFRDLVQGPHAT